jgi:putative ABC transport system substrate-binding protein
MRRREFITLLGGAATWPFVARAQQGERMRRVGVLVGSAGDADDTDVQARLVAFQPGIAGAGERRRWCPVPDLRLMGLDL